MLGWFWFKCVIFWVDVVIFCREFSNMVCLVSVGIFIKVEEVLFKVLMIELIGRWMLEI